MKAVVIAGGLGTRIRSVSGDLIPKAMVSVASEPIISRQLALLSKYGFNEVIVIAGHLADVLKKGVESMSHSKKMKINFAVESFPMGTAGGLKMVEKELRGDDFLVIYGDIVVDMDLSRFMQFHKDNKNVATIVSHPNDHPQTSDLLEADDAGNVLKILPKKNRVSGFYRNLVPSGIYSFHPDVFNSIEDGEKQDFIYDVFPRMLANQQKVVAYNTPEYLRDMGTPERYDRAEQDIVSGVTKQLHWDNKRPAVFFDRDGVLVKDIPGRGVNNPTQVELFPGVIEAIKTVNAAQWLAVVITNQPHVAKGFMSINDLDQVHAQIEMMLGAQGAWLDRIYYCPHHPEKGHAGEVKELKIPCECRKPKIGLFQRAIEELPIDLSRSVVIGDTGRDIEAAKSLGISGFGVRTGNSCKGSQPDMIFENVYDAVQYALGKTVKGSVK